MRFAHDATPWPGFIRRSLITRCRCLILNSLQQRPCTTDLNRERSNMIHRKMLQTIFLLTLLSATVQIGCNKTPPATSASANSSPTPASAQSSVIETEIVAPQPVAGVIPATGKILIPEDRVAVIGPVNEGRIVRLY